MILKMTASVEKRRKRMKSLLAVLLPATLLVQSGASGKNSTTILYKAKAVHTVSGETFRPGSILVREGLIAEV